MIAARIPDKGTIAMPSDHVVKSYDEELKRLNNTITEMGGLAESQLAAAIQAVMKRDTDLAAEVVEQDARVDQLERDVDAFSVRLLALRQPMARDLREILAALKIASDIERICDYSANVAKRSIALSQSPVVRPVNGIPRMGKLAQALITDVIDAYVQRDAEKAMQVWLRDEELDETYTSLFRELLTYMMEDPRNITPCTHLLFMAKNIERIGDHATNIAETLYFLVHGVPLKEVRPKRDRSSLAVVSPDDLDLRRDRDRGDEE
jgi:phosphate transport system protein